MKVIIKGAEQEIKATAVILEPNSISKQDIKMFFCLNCGQPTFQYSGYVIMVTDQPPTSQIPLLVRCKKCKHTYLIVSILSVQ